MTTIEILKNNLIGTMIKYEAKSFGIKTHVTFKLFKRGITNAQRESNNPYFYKYIPIEKAMGVHSVYYKSKIADVFLKHSWADTYIIKLENGEMLICGFDTIFDQIGNNPVYLIHNMIIER